MQLWNKFTKFFVALVVILVLVVTSGLIFLDWYLNSDTLKEHLAGIVEERTGIQVRFLGDLGVSIYPWLGLETGAVVAETLGTGAGTLATAESITAKVSLRQLFAREIDFDIVALSGLTLQVVRREDGSTNIDQLLQLAEPTASDTPLAWEGFDLSTLTVRGLRLDDSSIQFTDLASNLTIEAENIRLRTGSYGHDALLEFSLDADVHLPEQNIDITVGWMGQLEAAQDFNWAKVTESTLLLTASGHLFSDGEAMSHLTGSVTLDSKEQTASLEGFKLKLPKLLLSGSISGEQLLNEPQVQGHLAAARFTVRDALNHFGGDFIPGKDLGIFQDGFFSLDFALNQNDLSITNLDANCDKTRLQGSFTAHDFNNPRYGFEIAGNTLNFDRYYNLFIVEEPFILADFGPEFLGSVTASGTITFDQLTLAGGAFEDFVLGVEAGSGTSTCTLKSSKLWDGAVTGMVQAQIRKDESGGHPLALSCSMKVDSAAASLLPFLSGTNHVFEGRARAHFAFDMPETVLRAETNIDEVLRHTSGEMQYSIGGGTLLLRGDDGAMEATPFDLATASVKCSATKKKYADGSYGYSSGVSFKINSESENYEVAGRSNGLVRVSNGLDAVTVRSAKTGLQVSGSPLPPGESMLVLSGVFGLDTKRQIIKAKELRLEGKFGELTGELTGYRVFEEDFTYSGPFAFDSLPRRVFGLLDVEIGDTRDPDVLRNFKGTLDVAFTAEQAVLANLDLVFDDTHGTGKIRIENYETGYSTFKLNADALDINRYRPPKKERVAGKCNFPLAPAVSLPLITLSSANIDGDIWVGDFRIFDISFKGLTSHVNMQGGKISLPNLHCDFYGGQVNGFYEGTATREALVSNINLRAENFRGAAFMTDVSGKEYVDGTSTLFFDIQTTGATDDEFIANMSGRAGVTIMDGSYRFSGDKNPPKGNKPTDFAVDKRTNFEGAAALFRVDKGRFMTDDFRMEATYLTAVGAGNFDLDKDTIDLSLEAEYVVVPTVIPIHIVDCLHDPGVSIPGIEILGNTVKELIGLPLKPFKFLRDLIF